MVTQSLSHPGRDSPAPQSAWVVTAARITTVLALLTLLVLALVALTPAPSREITGSDLSRPKKHRHLGRDAISAPLAATDVNATPGASADWWSTVQEDLAQREYEARPRAEDGTLQAANRAQDFRTYYRPGGIAVVRRDSRRAESGDTRGSAASESTNPPKSSWEFTWRTRGWGRPGAMAGNRPGRRRPRRPPKPMGLGSPIPTSIPRVAFPSGTRTARKGSSRASPSTAARPAPGSCGSRAHLPASTRRAR